MMPATAAAATSLWHGSLFAVKDPILAMKICININ